MPNLVDAPIQGGPTLPVYLMNGLRGDPAESDDVSVTSGAVAVAGDNELIAAPAAGYRIVVYSFVIQNETDVETTIQLVDGAPRWRVLCPNKGDGLAMVFGAQKPWKLNEAVSLKMNLSGANSCGYSIQYALELV